MTIQQLQNFIDTKPDLRQLINVIADYIQENPGGATYKVYTALLSQSGTDVPIANVLLNTLGGEVVWSRNEDGNFIGTSNGSFTLGKTIFPPFLVGAGAESGIVLVPLYNADATEQIGGYVIFPLDENSFLLGVFDVAGDNIDLSTLAGTASILIKVEVYI